MRKEWKKLLITALFLSLGLSLTACMEDKEAAGYEDAVIDGSIVLSQNVGTPFAEGEIKTLIRDAKNEIDAEFEEGAYVSTHGYHAVSLSTEGIEYFYYMLPVIYEGEMVGEILLWRNSEGIAEVYSMETGGSFVGPINDVMSEYGEAILIHTSFSYYLVTEDNKVHPINGDMDPKILNPDSIYVNFKTDENTITLDIFNDEDYYYIAK